MGNPKQDGAFYISLSQHKPCRQDQILLSIAISNTTNHFLQNDKTVNAALLPPPDGGTGSICEKVKALLMDAARPPPTAAQWRHHSLRQGFALRG
jgi:hypothetical protein